MVEGPNFFFGHDRQGTIDTLRGYTSAEPALRWKWSKGWSSTARWFPARACASLLAAGRVDEARRMLTEPYRIRGMVTHGAGRGAKLGFPTANVDAIDTLLPGPGVYAGRAVLAEEHVAGGDQHRPQSHVRRAGLEGRSAPDRFRPAAVWRAAGGGIFIAAAGHSAFAGVDALHAQLERDVAAARQCWPGSVRQAGGPLTTLINFLAATRRCCP